MNYIIKVLILLIGMIGSISGLIWSYGNNSIILIIFTITMLIGYFLVMTHPEGVKK